MNDHALLASLTELLGKEADLLFAMINFYGLVVIAILGWIVNSGKESPGVSWFRVALFNFGFLAFFAASFAGFWYLYERIAATAALWSQTAARTGASAAHIDAIIWLPPREWLWGIWGLNGIILLLATVLLRQGGYGREDH